MHSVISILPICMHVVHDGLLLLRAEVVLAPLDCASSVRTGTGKVMLAMFVSQPNDTPTLLLCRTEVVRGLAVLVEVAGYLTITTGVTTMAASEASGFSGLWGGCASLEAVRLHLVVLALLLAELWVLPYKGLEAAGSVSSDEASSHLFLALGVLPPLVLVTKPLLSCEEFKAFDVIILAIELVRPSPTVLESDYICVHPVIPQPFQSSVKSAVHHVGFGQEGQVFFVVGWRGAASLDR
jgi:hypothetical protein